MATPTSDTYTATTGTTLVQGGRGAAVAAPIGFGVVGAAAAALGAGLWSDISASTNVVAITDTSVPTPVGSWPAGQATAWLEVTPDKPLTNWPGSLTWDMQSKQVLVVGCSNGFASEGAGGGEVVGGHSVALFFDLVAGVFSRQWNPMGDNVAHIYDSNATQPLNGYIYRRSYANPVFKKMDVATRVWSSAGSLSGSGFSSASDVPALELFPAMGASGSVLLLGTSGRLVRWDIATQTWAVISATTAGLSGSGDYVMSYHPSINAVVFGGGVGNTTLYRIDAAGIITTVSTTLPAGVSAISATKATTFAPDPQGRPYGWLFDGFTGRRAWRLNLIDGAWTDAGPFPGAFASSGNAAVATVQELGVHLFFDAVARGSSGPTTSPSKVWLFRPA